MTQFEKMTISSLRSLSIKLDNALKNPIWNSQSISGILIKGDKNYDIISNVGKNELIGVQVNNKLDSLLGKNVIVFGSIKEPGKIDVLTIHSKKENTLELFIMSQCPYGIQALQFLFAKEPLLKNRGIKLEMHYILSKAENTYTSLHGEQEIVEDIVQIILRDTFPQYFFEYLKQRIANPLASWEQIAKYIKIDSKSIAQIRLKITENRNLILAQEYNYMINNYTLISSSPTYIWENEIVNSLTKVPGFQSTDSSNSQKCSN
jgi:hypothetical protein